MEAIKAGEGAEAAPSGGLEPRKVVAMRMQRLCDALRRTVPLQGKMIQQVQSVAGSDIAYKRLSILADRIKDEEREGRDISPAISALLGLGLVDANPYETDRQGNKVRTGPKPRTGSALWDAAWEALEAEWGGAEPSTVAEIIGRGPGRPVGSSKPAEQRQEKRDVRMDVGRWEWCLSQPGGASEYIRSLIDRDRAAEGNYILD